MTILDKTRELAGKAVDGAVEVVDHVTGRTLVREAEKFSQEMESVYAALVMRVVTAEERIGQLERRMKWVIGFAISAIVVSLIAAFLKSW